MASRFLVPFGRHRGLMSPGDPFLDLHREMNRLFDDIYRGMGGSEGEPGGLMTAPRLDVHETENGLEISAELPGVSQDDRSEEHTSELQSLMRISYAVFCLKKKTKQTSTHNN